MFRWFGTKACITAAALFAVGCAAAVDEDGGPGNVPEEMPVVVAPSVPGVSDTAPASKCHVTPLDVTMDKDVIHWGDTPRPLECVERPDPWEDPAAPAIDDVAAPVQAPAAPEFDGVG